MEINMTAMELCSLMYAANKLNQRFNAAWWLGHFNRPSERGMSFDTENCGVAWNGFRHLNNIVYLESAYSGFKSFDVSMLLHEHKYCRENGDKKRIDWLCVMV